MVVLAVLIVAVLMAVLMSFAARRMDQRFELATTSKDKLRSMAQIYGKRNELTYLLATQRISAAGVSRGTNASGLVKEEGIWLTSYSGDEIRVDGFIYETPEIRFSIQNEAGLFQSIAQISTGSSNG